ncbi:hypothetical protein QWM81_04400 [Streptomyces ficellus]|uniref:Uncharacterized protein n=1 Tax=Streptomyces ficellus TaxID=1977088 RepID=A0ABT7Z1E0_9ACTN|nr:hypothetical protein [Streptomyces ficellus]MDN3293301.1 hypothetical protein [Streptomyces ficellus]
MTSVVTLDEAYTADQVLSLAASGELHVRRTEEQHLHIPIHQAREVVLGMGVRAELDGSRLLVGSPALLRQHGVALPEVAREWTERLRADGETVISLAHDDNLIGMLGLSDAVRGGADTVIRQLTELGVSRIALLVVANSARLVSHTPHLPGGAASRLGAAPLAERRVR